MEGSEEVSAVVLSGAVHPCPPYYGVKAGNGDGLVVGETGVWVEGGTGGLV
jgi:hypothetical protein